MESHAGHVGDEGVQNVSIASNSQAVCFFPSFFSLFLSFYSSCLCSIFSSRRLNLHIRLSRVYSVDKVWPYGFCLYVISCARQCCVFSCCLCQLQNSVQYDPRHGQESVHCYGSIGSRPSEKAISLPSIGRLPVQPRIKVHPWTISDCTMLRVTCHSRCGSHVGFLPDHCGRYY